MKSAAFLQADRFPPGVAVGYTTQAAGAAGARRSNEAFHGMSGSAAGGAYATAADLLAFDNALRDRRLLDAKMTAWILGGEATAAGRAAGDIGIAGGAPGSRNATLDSDGKWTVVVVGNLNPPNAARVAAAIREGLICVDRGRAAASPGGMAGRGASLVGLEPFRGKWRDMWSASRVSRTKSGSMGGTAMGST